MLSRRLWRSIVNADVNDPIFRRVSQISSERQATPRRIRLSRAVTLIGALASLAALIYAPSLLIVVMVIPILMITLMVVSPVLLPLAALIAGAQLTAAVVSGIAREKHQYTYDLICASTQGALKASWSCAIGMTHRGNWFAPLHWGTVAVHGCGLALLGGLGAIAVMAAVAGDGRIGHEQVRLLLLTALALALYASNLTHSVVLGLVCGLLASSFDLAKPDATLLGLLLYGLLISAPAVAAGLMLVAFGRLEPAPLLMRIAVEGAALLLIMALREAAIALLWSGLRRRLDWGRGEIESRVGGQLLVAQ